MTLTLRVDHGMVRALETAAAALNTPKTALARRFIQEGLTRTRAAHAGAMLEYAGCVNGPGKGATNANVRRKLKERGSR